MSRRTLPEAAIVQGLLDAYRRGYFPMAQDASRAFPGHATTIHWFSPDPRGVLPLTPADGLRVPRRLERTIRSRRFSLRVDTALDAVMRGCAAPRRSAADEPDDAGSWIDATILRWYGLLHADGHAHSVEAWARDPATGEQALVGGVYGVAIGAAFFGESMFHAPRPRRPDGSRDPLDGTDASKVCLVSLVRALAAAGFTLFDTQMVTPHVARFGGLEIPRREYLRRLDAAVNAPAPWAEAARTLTADLNPADTEPC